jgi:hypothetical protein
MRSVHRVWLGVLMTATAVAGTTEERARVLIDAALDGMESLSLRVKYLSRLRLPGPSSAHTRELKWIVDGDPVDGPVRCEQWIPDEGIRTVQIVKNGELYTVSRRGLEPWNSWIAAKGYEELPRTDPVQSYLRPISKERLSSYLRAHGIMEATVSAERIEIVVPVSARIRDAVEKDGVVMGGIGHRLVFLRRDGTFVLSTVESLGTAKVVVAENNGVLTWGAGGPFLKDSATVTVMGRLACGVLSRTTFDEFAKVQGVWLPKVVRGETISGESECSVVEDFVDVGGATGEEMVFRPPYSFGERGMHTDLRTGEEWYHGLPGIGEANIQEMLRQGETSRIGDDVRESKRGGWLWVVSMGVAGAVLAVLGLSMRRRGK